MSDATTPRRKPIRRKEVVETATWGEVVVQQLLLTDKLAISAMAPSAPETETDMEARVRNIRALGKEIAELLALSVTDKEGEPMFDSIEWEIWGSTVGDEALGTDLLALTNKARAMNGYRPLDGEDVAKNG